MAIKCFCDSCGKEIDKPLKAISIYISGFAHYPDLCEECRKKITELIYKHSGEYYHDDKK